MAMITLYQFPISHFCEKARWVLDYKQIEHEICNLLPGLHVSRTKKMGVKSSLPILDHDGKIIQGSGAIITHLDEVFPERSLTPTTTGLKDEALEWEEYLDNEIGIHLRLCCYHILLEHPDIVIPLFTPNGPWYKKLYMKMTFPEMAKKMRKYMHIDAESASRSREKVAIAVQKLDSRLRDRKFLVGDQFTRADLTAASLLAPLFRPKKYGLEWPDQYPAQFETLVNEFRPEIDRFQAIYREFR